MKVLILGSGVIGVTSAYYLARAGHEVTVVDRQPKPALETSFANAGEVSPGYSSPWAGPGVPVKAIKWLLMKHGPLVIRPKLDPVMWVWLLKMLRNCTAERYAVNKRRMIPIAEYSRDCLRALRAEIGIRYDERERRARCSCFATRPSSTTPPTISRCSSNMACPMKCSIAPAASPPSRRSRRYRTRSPADCGCRRTRPAIATCSRQALALEAEKLGVRFDFNVGDRRADRRMRRASPALPPRPACCRPTPTWSRSAAGRRGCCARSAFPLPVYPVKGYSITVPVRIRSGRAGLHRDGRELQGRDHAARQPHPRRRHRRSVGLFRPALSGAARDARSFPDRSVPARRRSRRGHVLERAAPDDPRRPADHRRRPVTPTCISTPATARSAGPWPAAPGRVLADMLSGRKPDIDTSELAITRYDHRFG